MVIMVIWILIIAAVLLLFIIPFLDGWSGKHTFSKLYGVEYIEIQENEETTEKEELHEINKNERLLLLDQTLVQYNKLIDNLAYQYENETNEKKKAVILKQQIAALEKYNKALERMEKLDN